LSTRIFAASASLRARLVKAFGGQAAGARRADVGLAADLEPDLRIGRGVEIGERAVARALAPFPDALHFLLLARGEELAAVAHRPLQPPRAEIILAALQQHRLELGAGSSFCTSGMSL
jgi:hypothetical protein